MAKNPSSPKKTGFIPILVFGFVFVLIGAIDLIRGDGSPLDDAGFLIGGLSLIAHVWALHSESDRLNVASKAGMFVAAPLVLIGMFL